MVDRDFTMTWALYISAGYNAAGAFGFAFPQLTPSMSGLPAAGHPLYTAIAILTITLFGAGYLWQAYSGRRDRTFLTLAAVGKLGFFLIFFLHWMGGTVPLMVMLSTSGDLLLGGYFLYWLSTAPLVE
jgi:hypothetical protein